MIMESKSKVKLRLNNLTSQISTFKIRKKLNKCYKIIENTTLYATIKNEL